MQMQMQVGQSGKKLFKEWDGLVTHEYLDSGGAPTIGIGHLLTRSERTSGKIAILGQAFAYRNELTEQQCWDLLDQDLDDTERTVNKAVTVPLNQNQFDALVSFAFNVGNGAFLGSTLLRLLNQGKYDQVPAQLRRWNRDNGHIVQGLINRRDKEIAL
ncbi:lysozyme [Azotobacter beijerinckii]|uniref:Lysozyme n=1 Tax=Azotobacter beijerinckii TaxID=170623 RepID=A0A1I4IV31_9GAMM|nr:lysozyme [Azotobacter beijerinckii]SFB65317.1 Phage-related lysozyme (muramidase), GH24 family [Azotobacter beijerinckii]SFL58229.1 Phage-related lysozyme (muramidase), GH24 family [Azotobacter beijerinckii]